MHAIIKGVSENQVENGVRAIKTLIEADDNSRTKLRHEQFEASLKLPTVLGNGLVASQETGEHLMTPYGPPDKDVNF